MSEWIRFEDMDSLSREEILSKSNHCFWPRDRESTTDCVESSAPWSIGRHEEDAEVCQHVLLNLGKHYFVDLLSPGIFKHPSALLAWFADGHPHLADVDFLRTSDFYLEVFGRALATSHDHLVFWTAYFDAVYDEFERRLDCGEKPCDGRWVLHWDVEKISEFAPNTVSALRPYVKERLGRLFVKAQGDCQVDAAGFLKMDIWGSWDGRDFFQNFQARDEELELIHEFLQERDARIEAAEIAAAIKAPASQHATPRRAQSL